ncbi:MAG: hypothetical protein MZU84_01485 [Sphingobacterium sp.]|nr:hypothetical protein [Sphingobacterium sp.]
MEDLLAEEIIKTRITPEDLITIDFDEREGRYVDPESTKPDAPEPVDRCLRSVYAAILLRASLTLTGATSVQYINQLS